MNQQVQKRAYVSFMAEVVPATVEPLLGLCSNLAQTHNEIYVMLSTPGGSVMHGIAAYNVLRALPAKIIMHNVGSVDSIGNVLFLAGDERYACPSSTFMFHGVGFDIMQPMRMEVKFLRERLDSLNADEAKIGSVIVDRTSLAAEEVSKLFLEAVTRDPHYAKSNGIIHDIREAKVPPGAAVHQLVFKR